MTNKFPMLLTLAMTLAACGANDHVSADGVMRPKAEALSPFIASKNNLFKARLEWVSGLPRPHKLNAGRVQFFDMEQQVAQRVDAVTAMTSMPAHSHPAVPVQFNQVASGPANVWNFSGLDPMMGGDWQLRVTATVNGNTDTVDLTYYAQ